MLKLYIIAALGPFCNPPHEVFNFENDTLPATLTFVLPVFLPPE